MKKRQTIKYIVFDTLSAMVAWASLFLFRKLVLEHTAFHDAAGVFSDTNFWTGLVAVPLGWLSLYTIMGTYRGVLRKARLKEFLDTLGATLIGGTTTAPSCSCWWCILCSPMRAVLSSPRRRCGGCTAVALVSRR